jgi:hypothetical protein
VVNGGDCVVTRDLARLAQDPPRSRDDLLRYFEVRHTRIHTGGAPPAFYEPERHERIHHEWLCSLHALSRGVCLCVCGRPSFRAGQWQNRRALLEEIEREMLADQAAAQAARGAPPSPDTDKGGATRDDEGPINTEERPISAEEGPRNDDEGPMSADEGPAGEEGSVGEGGRDGRGEERFDEVRGWLAL